MKRTRSIRAQLIIFYVVTLTLIFICFGAYTYWGCKEYLLRSMRLQYGRRANLIATTILTAIPQRGEAFVGDEIRARYAFELNDRIIRVSDQTGRIIFASKYADLLGAPLQPSFDTSEAERPPVHQREIDPSDQPWQVVAVGYRAASGTGYVVEVAGSESQISSALDGLMLTFGMGFPFFIGLSTMGVYNLLNRALRPVSQIVTAAERITLLNLSQRLPVSATGDEIESLTLALNRMIQRLEQSYQVTSRFAADASHELRTPLTIMRGELEELLQEGMFQPEHVAPKVQSVLEEADRLTQIIDGLLTISRLEGERHVDQDPVDLAELAKTTVEQMLPLAEEKSIALICEAETEVMIDATKIRLKQVIVNLIDNAIKYTPEGGKIIVRVSSEALRALLEVTDNGIGISPDALPHVFERFYRSDQPKARNARGTGLGLSMVQSIVEAHHGKVTVESRENSGSVFRIQLPCLGRVTGQLADS